MTLTRTLALALLLSSGAITTACGGGGEDAAPAAEGDAPAAPEGDAPAAPEGDAPAAAAPAADAGQAADAAEEKPAADAAGNASARMVGTWGVSLPPEEQAKLDEARKTLETNPEDQGAKMLVGMMDGMLNGVVLNVTADTLTMNMAGKANAIPYTVTDDTPEGCTLDTKEADGKVAQIKVSFNDAGVMVWTKEGEKAPMHWAKK